MDNSLLKGHPTPLDSSKMSIKEGYYTLPDKEKSRGSGKGIGDTPRPTISIFDVIDLSAMSEGKMYKNVLLSNEALKHSLLPVPIATSSKLGSPSISVSS